MSRDGRATPRMTFWQAVADRGILMRGLRVAAVIGTLLILINQGDLLLEGTMPPLWKLLLTYAVPFGVSTYSAAQHRRHREGG
ncbi:MAG: hypothetical protein KatS3mg119_2146 [Rhodothalassiaceae bacterium]|nr:MAG: hypothetical protein KatS3mg119_2146 [Rhodothalassiaceae bacterium]